MRKPLARLFICLVANPLLFFIDVGIVLLGVDTWRNTRQITNNAMKEAWDK